MKIFNNTPKVICTIITFMYLCIYEFVCDDAFQDNRYMYS